MSSNSGLIQTQGVGDGDKVTGRSGTDASSTLPPSPTSETSTGGKCFDTMPDDSNSPSVESNGTSTLSSGDLDGGDESLEKSPGENQGVAAPNSSLEIDDESKASDKPEWARQLSATWEKEIDNMSDDEAAWFHVQDNMDWINDVRSAWTDEVVRQSTPQKDEWFFKEQEKLFRQTASSSSSLATVTPDAKEVVEAMQSMALKSPTRRTSRRRSSLLSGVSDEDAATTASPASQSFPCSQSLPASSDSSTLALSAEKDRDNSISRGDEVASGSDDFTALAKGKPIHVQEPLDLEGDASGTSISSNATSSQSTRGRSLSHAPFRTDGNSSKHGRRSSLDHSASASSSGKSVSEDGRVKGLFRRFWSKVKRKGNIPQYSESIRKCVDLHEKKIFYLQNERKNARTRMKEDLEKWRRYGEVTLVGVGERYYSTKLTLLTAMLDVEWQYCDVLSSAITSLQRSVDGKVPLDPVFLDDAAADGFLKPSELERVLGGTAVEAKAAYCLKLQQDLQTVKTTYDEMCKVAKKPVPHSDRVVKLKQILLSSIQSSRQEQLQDVPRGVNGLPAKGTVIKRDDFYFHIHDTRIQDTFNRMMVDLRQTEGQLLEKWRQFLSSSDPKTIPPSGIVTFVEHFVVNTMQRYEIVLSVLSSPVDCAVVCADIQGVRFSTLFEANENSLVGVNLPSGTSVAEAVADRLLPCMRLLTERLLYPSIVQVTEAMVPAEDRKKDEEISSMRVWMKNLSQGDVGITRMFRKPPQIDGEPYAEATAILAKMEGECVPSNILRIAYESVKVVLRTAKLYYSHHKQSRISDIMSDLVDTPSNKPTSPATSIPYVNGSSLTAAEHKVDIIADDLFPIMVWVVIHSPIDHLHRLLFLLKHFSDENSRHFGEVGMAVSLVEAAVYHMFEMDAPSSSKGNGG